MPRGRRVRRRAEFQRIYNRGIRVAGRHMVLFALPAKGVSRFGVTASRRVGNAVVRARCKRRARELYRTRGPGVADRPFDLVVNARSSLATAPWPAVVSDFDDCLARLTRRVWSHRH